MINKVCKNSVIKCGQKQPLPVPCELVNMIFMQKMYQASAQVISTDKTLTQTILQL
ncbi:MAG: hypothetical protein B7X74_05050 [Thiotrichales bacterium 39-47-5]|nr:MAG: hypothetical protein B7X74_05050 [Thiotrichales bacterium 39-47-5]